MTKDDLTRYMYEIHSLVPLSYTESRLKTLARELGFEVKRLKDKVEVNEKLAYVPESYPDGDKP